MVDGGVVMGGILLMTDEQLRRPLASKGILKDVSTERTDASPWPAFIEQRERDLANEHALRDALSVATGDGWS